MLSKRQMGDGGVMVWAATGYDGKTDVVFVTHRLTGARYITIVHEQLTHHAARIAGEKYIFQQDNAAVSLLLLCVVSSANRK